MNMLKNAYYVKLHINIIKKKLHNMPKFKYSVDYDKISISYK